MIYFKHPADGSPVKCDRYYVTLDAAGRVVGIAKGFILTGADAAAFRRAVEPHVVKLSAAGPPRPADGDRER